MGACQVGVIYISKIVLRSSNKMSNHKPNDATGTETGRAFQAYQFHNPGRARLRVSTPDEPLTCDTSGAVWTWHAHGSRYQITWSDLIFPVPLAEICKAFIFYRLQSRAPITVARDAAFIQLLATLPQVSEFPWDEKRTLTIFAILGVKDPVLAILLRVFLFMVFRDRKARLFANHLLCSARVCG